MSTNLIAARRRLGYTRTMPRKRKPGPRTRSGRLSRAHKCAAGDTGTPEFCAKRRYLIDGADPQLAASASGILLTNGFLSRQ